MPCIIQKLNLFKIVHELYHLMQEGIQYRGVRASNVYITAVKNEKNETIRYRVELGELTFSSLLKYTYIDSKFCAPPKSCSCRSVLVW